MGKVVKDNPDKIGALKFWAWQGRAVSAAINFIILGFVTIYCTNTLLMPAALVGTLFMASKMVDGVTDLFAGFVVDKTNTKLGKGRPYELAILGVWLSTWLLYSTPGDASLMVKSIWVLTTYIFINSVFVTLLSACNNAYMVRAFKTNGQRVKIASFGGLVIMLSAIIVNISFPILMNRIATSPEGWSKLMAMIAIPMALIGIMRFVFVKETEQVEVTEEKAHWSSVIKLLRTNPYVYIVAFMQFAYAMVTGMGIMTFFFSVVVGNIELMGMAMSISILVLPLLFFFPRIMRTVPMGKMVRFGSLAYILGGITIFMAGGNFPIIMISFIFTGLATLPITYLTDLMMIDCGSYNAWKGNKRMDGTIGAIKGFANKIGSALGSGLMGILLGMSGYNGALEIQPDSALLMIRILTGILPATLFLIVFILMFFYKLDKLMPKIREELEVNA